MLISFSSKGVATPRKRQNVIPAMLAGLVTIFCVGAMLAAPKAHALARGTIITVAGNGTPGFGGEGGPAIQALISEPEGMSFDSKGNLYFADLMNHRVRRIGKDGIITTVAGHGPDGFPAPDGQPRELGSFSGDGGPATAASLNLPGDVVVDKEGNLFIADQNNHRIRRVRVDGIIETFAGDGGPSPSEVHPINNKIAVNSPLGLPAGVAIDSTGSLLITDDGVNLIFKVDPSGRLTTFKTQFYVPRGIVADAEGNFYVTTDRSVVKVDAEGNQHTVRSDLKYPEAVALDAAGNLFVADTQNCRILKVTPQGITTRIAGGFPRDPLNGLHSFGYSGDGGPASMSKLNSPKGIAIDGQGNLFISDTGNQRIREVIGVAAGATSGPLIGDVNGDGVVKVADATLALRAAVGTTTLTPDQTMAADLNGDGVITLQDVVLLLQLNIGQTLL